MAKITEDPAASGQSGRIVLLAKLDPGVDVAAMAAHLATLNYVDPQHPPTVRKDETHGVRVLLKPGVTAGRGKTFLGRTCQAYEDKAARHPQADDPAKPDSAQDAAPSTTREFWIAGEDGPTILVWLHQPIDQATRNHVDRFLQKSGADAQWGIDRCQVRLRLDYDLLTLFIQAMVQEGWQLSDQSVSLHGFDYQSALAEPPTPGYWVIDSGSTPSDREVFIPGLENSSVLRDIQYRLADLNVETNQRLITVETLGRGYVLGLIMGSNPGAAEFNRQWTALKATLSSVGYEHQGNLVIEDPYISLATDLLADVIRRTYSGNSAVELTAYPGRKSVTLTITMQDI